MRLNNRGFSLIEILITVGLIGILSGLAIPAYQTYQEKTKRGVAESIIQTALRTIQLNQSIGQVSSSEGISATVRSKGASIDNLVIHGSGLGEVRVNEAVYCVSIPAKGEEYPAACGHIKQEGGGCSNSNVTTEDACTGTWTPPTIVSEIKYYTDTASVCTTVTCP